MSARIHFETAIRTVLVIWDQAWLAIIIKIALIVPQSTIFYASLGPRRFLIPTT